MQAKRSNDDVPSLMRRAKQMARSGEYEFLYQIERQLKAEGYRRVEATFEGDSALRKEVRHIIGERR